VPLGPAAIPTGPDLMDHGEILCLPHQNPMTCRYLV
jgi:hypothetical protein